MSLTHLFSAILTASSIHYSDFRGDVNRIVGGHFSTQIKPLYKQQINVPFRMTQGVGKGFICRGIKGVCLVFSGVA
jgi:hypothetical protein